MARGPWWWQASLRTDRPPVRRALLVFVLDFFLSLAVGLAVDKYVPAVSTAARAGLEAFQLFEPEQPGTHVVLVNITPEDFQERFDGRSPLKHCVLRKLIERINEFKPLLIAVDIDTSHVDYCPLNEALDPYGRIGGGTVVIWARGGLCETGDNGPRCALDPVLGVARGFEESSRFGLAVFKRDPDGVAREFTRCVDADIGGETLPYPTFHWSIAASIVDYDDSLLSANPARSPIDADSRIRRPHNPCQVELQQEDVLVLPRIRYRFAELSMGEVMGGAESSSIEIADSRKNIFFRKVVIVGGTYDLRDQHLTAFNRVNSHQLLARAIEAERRGEITNRTPEFVGWLIGVVLAIVIAWLHHKFIPWVAGSLTCLVMTLVPVALSLIAFLSLDYWLEWLPTLLCFWLMEAYSEDPVELAAGRILRWFER